MNFRKATEEDLKSIIDIIKHAQDHLKEQGIDQWQDGYPNAEVIGEDIDDGNSYVLLKGNIIIGTVAVSFDGEKTYNNIHKGKWITQGQYGVIHRLAINKHYRGLGFAKEILKYIEKLTLDNGIKSIKVDTHKNNQFMQKLLEKNGFVYCGIIHLEDGNERLAFEKKL